MILINRLLGRERVLITENERAIHLWKGQVQGILRPGEHMLSARKNRLDVELHDFNRPELVSDFEKAIFDKLPDVAAEHFTVVRTGRGEVAVIERDGAIYAVLGPDSKRVFWTDAGPWSHVVIDAVAELVIPADLARRMANARKLDQVAWVSVRDGQVAMIYVDGAFEQMVEAGGHAFWRAGRAVEHKLVDLKRQAIEVTGQEILTRDRVTLRVNISAQYRVNDAVKAVTEVKDFNETLYRALQLAFRATLGSMTLDQVLEQKVSVDAEASAKVVADMAAIGIEVSEIAIKDVILPGEMRDILNQVVAAEKEAEANVIRRREETNATRSLLNTAKVMSDNPVMLRLKELEALEVIAERVDQITVHSGTDGLLNDLVKLRG